MNAVVMFIDLETNRLIRQIPSEELVEIARVARVMERLEGLLFRQRA